MFKHSLFQILKRTEGSLGVLIMGLDGIPVEKAWRDEAANSNLGVAASEYTSLVRHANISNQDTGLGGLNEITVSNDSAVFMMRLLGKDYFLVLIMDPTGNFGRGRYELRRAELMLEREFSV